MATTPNSTTFYVYALARPVKKEWRIFYIGKGKGDRIWWHEDKEARRGHKCHKCNIIRKVWREGGEIQRYILLTTEDEQEAFAYEKEMIALHGRENLCNQTDGGDGMSRTMPASHRQNISKGLKRYLSNPDNREARRLRMQRIYADPQRRLKMVNLQEKIANDPTVESKRLANLRAALAKPEVQERRAAANRATNARPEVRAKQRATRQAQLDARGYVPKSKGHSNRWTPERSAQHSEAMKRAHASRLPGEWRRKGKKTIDPPQDQ